MKFIASWRMSLPIYCSTLFAWCSTHLPLMFDFQVFEDINLDKVTSFHVFIFMLDFLIALDLHNITFFYLLVLSTPTIILLCTIDGDLYICFIWVSYKILAHKLYLKGASLLECQYQFFIAHVQKIKCMNIDTVIHIHLHFFFFLAR